MPITHGLDVQGQPACVKASIHIVQNVDQKNVLMPLATNTHPLPLGTETPWAATSSQR